MVVTNQMEQIGKRLKKELNGKIIRIQNFVSYLLLSNKLFLNSSANDSKCVLSHSFRAWSRNLEVARLSDSGSEFLTSVQPRTGLKNWLLSSLEWFLVSDCWQNTEVLTPGPHDTTWASPQNGIRLDSTRLPLVWVTQKGVRTCLWASKMEGTIFL